MAQAVANREEFVAANERTPQEWADLINGEWRKTVVGIIRTGQLLDDAINSLPHGGKMAMYERLDFCQQTANKLVIISRDPEISNYAHVRKLPPSYGTLYELTKYDKALFKTGLSEGIITPDAQRTTVVKFYKEHKRKNNPLLTKAYTGDVGVICGDFRAHQDRIEDDSVSLIFTDPPYNKKTIPIYEDLAKFAEAKLVDGGSLVTYLGDYALPEVMELITPHLTFAWPLVMAHTGNTQLIHSKTTYSIHVKSKLMLWFRKGQALRLTRDPIDTLIYSEQEKCTHEWQQGRKEAKYLISRLCPEGGLVVDPFCGGGTTAVVCKSLGMKYLTYEIDLATAELARQRIADA